MSWLLWPRMLATNPMPHASCSCAGLYSPWTGGRPLMKVFRVIIVVSTKDTISRVAETVHHPAAENLGRAGGSAEIGFRLLKYLVANQKVQFRISTDELEISKTLQRG